jgi:hypothetical protein
VESEAYFVAVLPRKGCARHRMTPVFVGNSSWCVWRILGLWRHFILPPCTTQGRGSSNVQLGSACARVPVYYLLSSVAVARWGRVVGMHAAAPAASWAAWDKCTCAGAALLATFLSELRVLASLLLCVCALDCPIRTQLTAGYLPRDKDARCTLVAKSFRSQAVRGFHPAVWRTQRWDQKQGDRGMSPTSG